MISPKPHRRNDPDGVSRIRQQDHLAGIGCVIGDVRPDGVRADVTGSAAEYGCLEPFTH